MRHIRLILAALLIPMAVSAAPTRKQQPAATPAAVLRFTDSPIFFQSAPDIRVDLDFENATVRVGVVEPPSTVAVIRPSTK